jgi:hypothetical protein
MSNDMLGKPERISEGDTLRTRIGVTSLNCRTVELQREIQFLTDGYELDHVFMFPSKLLTSKKPIVALRQLVSLRFQFL